MSPNSNNDMGLNDAPRPDWHDAIVYLIDDDPLARESVIQLFSEHGVHVLAFESISTFVSAYRPERIGCLLVGLRHRLDALIEALAQLKSLDSSLPIILVAQDADIPTAVAAFKAGVFDLIEQPAQSAPLFEKVRNAVIHHRESWQILQARRLAAAKFAKLTSREYDILRLVMSGLTSPQIAVRLSRSLKTIEAHRTRILAKTGTRSVGELVQIAIRAGISAAADGEANEG